jgi:putative membrane protein
MIKILIRVLVTAATVYLLSQYVDGIHVDSFYTAFIVAIIWGIMGLTVLPVLKLLTLPITLITFGLFSLILNALMFWLLATFIKGFEVAGFVPALIGTVILSVVAWAMHAAFASTKS